MKHMARDRRLKVCSQALRQHVQDKCGKNMAPSDTRSLRAKTTKQMPRSQKIHGKDIMDRAVKEVKSGRKLGVTARKYGIPASTLSDHANGKYKGYDTQFGPKPKIRSGVSRLVLSTSAECSPPRAGVDHSLDTHVCGRCYKSFDGFISLQEHKLQHVQPGEMMKCPLCPERVLPGPDLLKHISVTHRVGSGNVKNLAARSPPPSEVRDEVTSPLEEVPTSQILYDGTFDKPVGEVPCQPVVGEAVSQSRDADLKYVDIEYTACSRRSETSFPQLCYHLGSRTTQVEALETEASGNVTQFSSLFLKLVRQPCSVLTHDTLDIDSSVSEASLPTAVATGPTLCSSPSITDDHHQETLPSRLEPSLGANLHQSTEDKPSESLSTGNGAKSCDPHLNTEDKSSEPLSTVNGAKSCDPHLNTEDKPSEPLSTVNGAKSCDPHLNTEDKSSEPLSTVNGANSSNPHLNTEDKSSEPLSTVNGVKSSEHDAASGKKMSYPRRIRVKTGKAMDFHFLLRAYTGVSVTGSSVRYGITELRCLHCSFRTTWQPALVTHMRGKHPETLGIHNMLEMSNTTPDNNFTVTRMSDFLKDQRKPRVNRYDAPGQYPCATCRKVFGRLRYLQRHQKTHLSDRPHLCDHCGKSFKTRGGLVAHCRAHHPDGRRLRSADDRLSREDKRSEEFLYRCPQCSFMSSSRKAAHGHRQVHPCDAPLCDTCGAAYTDRSALRRHTRVHDPSRPFPCGHPGCTWRFKTAVMCRAHERGHNTAPRREFPCQVCGHSFRQKHHLQRHTAKFHRDPTQSRDERDFSEETPNASGLLSQPLPASVTVLSQSECLSGNLPSTHANISEDAFTWQQNVTSVSGAQTMDSQAATLTLEHGIQQEPHADHRLHWQPRRRRHNASRKISAMKTAGADHAHYIQPPADLTRLSDQDAVLSSLASNHDHVILEVITADVDGPGGEGYGSTDLVLESISEGQTLVGYDCDGNTIQYTIV